MPSAASQLPPGTDWIERRLAALEQRVRELGAQRALPASNFTGGLFRFQDTSGQDRLELGNVDLAGDVLDPAAAYGVFGRGDDDGIALMLREGDRGLIEPIVPLPFHTSAAMSITSGSFVGPVECVVNWAAHEVIYLEGTIITDAGTSGEMKLVDGYSGAETDVLTLPDDTNAHYHFEWLHPGSVGIYEQLAGTTTSMFLSIHLRRTGGAGNVVFYYPRSAEMTSRFLHPAAATNGNPHL